ncbi:MAG: BPL-N domain-containing protein [Promethearchaeota archaeon]
MSQSMLASSRSPVFLYVVALLVSLSLMPSHPIVFGQSYSETIRTDLTGINVAVYNDTSSLDSSAIALKAMFDWMSASTAYVDGDELSDTSVLDNYDMLVYPGGSTTGYYYELGEEGRQKVKEFVASGGSYFGICGGSVFGTNSGRGLFNGIHGSSVAGTGTYLMDLNVNRSSTGPDLSDEPETYSTLYWGSTYFSGPGMADAIPIMTYPGGGQAAMLVCRYQLGTVFISSPHPEYEEGDSRDGTDAFDDLNDPDSEWGLMLKISIWLVEIAGTELPNSTTTTTTTTPDSPSASTSPPPLDFLLDSPLVIAALVGGLGIVALVVVLLRRR